MYKLYWAENTGAMAPQMLLEEIGADYERIVVDLDAGEHRDSEYLAINPRAQIPTLVLPDDEILTESGAIVVHLAECHADAGLLPEPGSSARARVLRWLFYAVANLYEADLRVYYPADYVADPACADALLTQARHDLDRYWELLESRLGDGPYFLGERFSLLDPYLLMLAYWHERPAELLTRSPRLERICARVLERPACRSVWLEHHPDGVGLRE